MAPGFRQQWVTLVLARVCVERLRASGRPGPAPAAALTAGLGSESASGSDPWGAGAAAVTGSARERALADSAVVALVAALEGLTVDERLAVILHQLFGLPFEQVASMIGVSAFDAERLARRAASAVTSGGSLDVIQENADLSTPNGERPS